MKSCIVGRKSPLLPLAVSMMAGIVIGDYWPPVVPLWPFLVLSVVGAIALWHYKLLQSVAIAICFVLFGCLLIQRQKVSLQVEWPAEEVRFGAVVVSEPVEKPKTVAVDILIAESGQRLKCYLYKDNLSRTLKIGDGLRIQSRIQRPEEWKRGRFDYRRYLEIHGFTGTTFVSSWKWEKEKLSLRHLPIMERVKLYFMKLRSQLLGRIKIADKDVYAVVSAMTFGDKSTLSRHLKDVYSMTGASHILALSGLHLGIIYSLLSFFVSRRRQVLSQFLLVLFIWAYVLLVGLSTSVVRSAVMLSTYALLSLGNRDKMSVNILAFTAVVMLMQNPLSLFDVGFQMSYMAVFSILVFMPLFDSWVSQRFLQSHRVLRWSWGMVAVSVAAQIGVAPLIAYYFGRISTIFMLTNFIVVPAAVLIIVLTIVVVMVPSLAYLLLYIVGLQNRVLIYLSAIPGTSIENLQPSGLQVSMVYVIIGAAYLLASRLTYIPSTVGCR